MDTASAASRPRVHGAHRAGRRVCVTGASGFLGSHIVGALLEAGHHVVATVRAPATNSKVGHLRHMAERAAGTLDIVELDILDRQAVRTVVSSCTWVCHSAAVVAMQSKDPTRDIIVPAVEGTRHVFEAVLDAPNVERVVLTSSVAAIRDEARPVGHVFSEVDWNDSAVPDSAPYHVAKTRSERLAWELHEAAKRRYSLATINPTVVFGPVTSPRHLATSPQIVGDLLKRRYPVVPRLGFGIVDVRDVAALHVAAFERAATGRHLACSGHLWLREMSSILHRELPGCRAPTRQAFDWIVYLASSVDGRLSWSFLRRNLGIEHRYDSSRAWALLGRDPIAPAESLVATAMSLRQLGLA